MRLRRFPAGTRAADIRALTPPPRDVEEAVREIIAEVLADGDDAVRSLTERFDHAELGPDDLAVPPSEIEAAITTLEPGALNGVRLAIENVRAVARAQLRDPVSVSLAAGHEVTIAEEPVRRAAAYVPGGRAPYPSTVVMCAITARTAGVDELAVCAPPGPEGRAHPAILAACGLCGVTEVYRIGGAQAIAALAYGTESVRPVDVIVGPGNRWVTEAKRQVAGVVGIDGLAGPSELVLVAGPDANSDLAAIDLLAQGEHGPDSLLIAISPDRATLDRIASAAEAMAADRPTVVADTLALVEAADTRAAVRLADALAPEHLQLVGAEPESLAGDVRSAGALFVGQGAGTAFGDYVAGSNHVLPTGAAARFASGLSVSTFTRRMARISLPEGAAAQLAGPGAALARAEGFPVHAESMERRS